MPTTSFTDADFGVRSVGDRTDAAGLAVSDLSAREDALVNHALTAGVVKPDGAFTATADGVSMTVTIGSGGAFQDLAVIESDQVQQPPYLVRLNAVSVAVGLDASGATARVDQLFLVVEDNTWDATGRSLARIGYRKGDEGAGAPGPDAGWSAWLLLATVAVAGGATSIAQGDVTDGRVQSTLLDRLVSATFALDADLDAHTGAANPHSGSASTTALNNHASASNPHTGSASTADLNAHTGDTHAHIATVSTAADPQDCPGGIARLSSNSATNPEGRVGGAGMSIAAAPTPGSGTFVTQFYGSTNDTFWGREGTGTTWGPWRRLDNV
jgi:hypothetical protein